MSKPTRVRRRRLNAPRRRALKGTLAARDGSWCAYCGRLFADLRYAATIDHVMPLSLLDTWRSEDLVLACRPCNDAKADRLPLLLALLVLDRHGRPALDRSADPNASAVGSGEHAESGVHAVPGRVFTPGVCALLARLAGAVESGAWPDRSADRPHQQSRADQQEQHRASGSPDAVNASVNGGVRALNAVRTPRSYAHVAPGAAPGRCAGLEAA